jgi:hypothetical protein
MMRAMPHPTPGHTCFSRMSCVFMVLLLPQAWPCCWWQTPDATLACRAGPTLNNISIVAFKSQHVTGKAQAG